MQARIKWVEGVTFMAESGSGHAIILDGASEHGGRNLGPRPMEAVLIGLGGCASFDVVTILKKARQDVVGCVLELEAERANAVPAVFTHIDLHYRVVGRNLRESAVRRAVNLSAETYCSVTAMLRDKVVIEHRFSIESA